MSAFSRGCLLRKQLAFKPLRTIFYNSPKSCQQPRFFSASTLLCAAKKARISPSAKLPPAKLKPSYTPTGASPTVSSALPAYVSYATTLAQKSHPTPLYEAPSHTAFMLTSYGTGLFCMTYATISFWSNYIQAPEGLATWVPVAFSGICFMMAGFGGWFLLGPSRIIKSIIAVPKGLDTAVRAASKSAVSTTGAAQAAVPELRIEVELKKMFPVPFFPARKLYVKPDEIILPIKLVPPGDPRITGQEMLKMRREEEMMKAQRLAYEKSHILSSYTRHMSQAFHGMFSQLSRSFTRAGFMKVEVDGQKYKLDVAGGWALDGGKALDRLAKQKPKVGRW